MRSKRRPGVTHETMAHHHDSHHEHEHHGVGHVVSPKILWTNAIALLILTGITVAVAKLDFMAFNIYEGDLLIALAVAVVKASLVCLFFMHLYWDRPFNSFVLIASIAFVGLFMGFAMIDVAEYRDQLLPGDAPRIEERLGAAPAPPPPPPATGLGAPGNGTGTGTGTGSAGEAGVP